MFTEPPKSSMRFEVEIDFDATLNLSSAFELFLEFSESIGNVKRECQPHLSKQQVIECISVQKGREENLTQSNTWPNSRKDEKDCNISVNPKDEIKILKCNWEMMNEFSISNYIDMVDVRENLRYNASFFESTDDEASIGSDFSFQTIDSIEYTKAKLPHLCHHDACHR